MGPGTGTSASATATVRIAVISGAAGGLEYVYERRTTALVGRADDCDPQLPTDDSQVSRHHCLVDINPPHVRVRDFGSLNGTHVNEVEIGRREPGQTPDEGSRLRHAEHDLRDGDELRVGRTTLRVSVTTPAGVPDEAPVPPSAPRHVLTRLLEQAEHGDPAVAGLSGYRLVREVGRGAQGAVYLARHRSGGAPVAVKTLLANVAVQPHARAGFLREIATMGALHHPNIVRLLDNGVSGTTFWFACEYCSGGNATALAGPDGRVPVEEAVPLVLQVLEGLAHAHDRGLVHRDIKPANVLLAETGGRLVAKLGDFGLAKAFDDAGLSGHTRTGAVAGTVTFMARAQLVDYRFAKPVVDVWAVAASLYTLLTGRPVRDFDDALDPILVVLRRPAVPVRTRLPTLPAPLAEVIDAALVEGPEARITTAAGLAAALRGAR